MSKGTLHSLPHMLFADDEGTIYDHPYYRMAGFSGAEPVALRQTDLIPVPKFSKLFFIPDCPPMGQDPFSGKWEIVREVEVAGIPTRCHAVAAFLEPGLVRNHLPAADYSRKQYVLPSWAYTAVGFKGGRYWASGFRIEYNRKWDPRNYDDRKLIPAVKAYRKGRHGPLLNHLVHCALENHCFAAKNLFLRRWEAPLPVSRRCNADCLGCLSLQPHDSCPASHQRISFRPRRKEIVETAVSHLEEAPEAIVSFGQGCEGEPLMESELIGESIKEIRVRTKRGTINLNTNGSLPKGVLHIAECGLDSIRISLNSARPELYRAYYRPRNYSFEDVVASIALARERGLYTMINYLVFPGITDQEEEIAAFEALLRRTGVQFVHLKNLCIDPRVYLEKMPAPRTGGVGMAQMVARLRAAFPHMDMGYFNQPVR